MTANEKILLASYIRANHLQKQAGIGGLALGAADAASYAIPGVGTARMGYDAYKDFSQGNYISGAANVLGAGLSLLPGVGGLAGRGVSALGRFAGRGLIRAGAPTLGKVLGRGLGMAGKGMGMTQNVINKGVNRVGQGVVGAVGRIPRVGQMGAKTISNVGTGLNRFSISSPGKFGLGQGAMAVGAGMAQDGVNEAKAITQQTQQGMNDMLENMRRSPVMTNPMFAGGGRNMRIGF